MSEKLQSEGKAKKQFKKEKSKSGKGLQKSSLESHSSSSSSDVSSASASSSSVIDSKVQLSEEAAAEEAEDNRSLLKRIFEKISHDPNDWANCTAIRIELVTAKKNAKNPKSKEGGESKLKGSKQTKAVDSVKVTPKSVEGSKTTATKTGSGDEKSAKKKTQANSPRKAERKEMVVRKEESKQNTEH